MIGVFDSGFGGLTVLNKLNESLPQYQYIYFGDNARAPYGSKSQEAIYNYTKEGVDFLFKQGCELVIIACNTASSEALRRIQREYLPDNFPERRVLGVLIPVVETLVEDIRQSQKLKNKKAIIGIIGTKATVVSKSYDREICKLISDVTIHSVATPLLVPLVEEGFIGRRETKLILKKYLKSLVLARIDYLVLGCTHYPFLEKQIREIINNRIKIINTPDSVLIKLKAYLDKHKEIERKIVKSNKRMFFTSDDSENFKKFFNNYFKKGFSGQEVDFQRLKQIDSPIFPNN